MAWGVFPFETFRVLGFSKVFRNFRVLGFRA